MGSVSFKILSLNARRFERQDKILNIKHFCELSSADVICFQEIHITTALKIFSSQYQVYVNFNNNQDIGIVTVVKKGFKIIDFAMCNQGRIIGIKLSNTQIWNVYAASGSGNKKERESFFRESLPNLMSIWKDQSQNVIQLGDHNCTQRYADSENIAWQKHHVQAGLNAQMELFGLRDELLRLKGNDVQGIYSRVTNVSKTRIDFIMSNTDLCTEFQYIDTDFLNLDHKASFANYSIDLEKDYRERVPKNRFFPGWVISKELENDETFLSEVKTIFDDFAEEEDVNDWTYLWLLGKYQMIDVAKKRERYLYKLNFERKNTLQIFLRTLLTSIANGNDRWNEYNRVKAELVKICDKASESAIDSLKFVHIEDHLYDLQKLKAQKKYENKGKINKIVIDGTTFSGTEGVVNGIREKLVVDLSESGDAGWNDPVSEEESFFLNKVLKLNLSNEDISELLGPVQSEEVNQILHHEVDLDSSPGEDGITYRILKKLIEIPSFLSCMIKMLDHIRVNKNMGSLENMGIMKLLNKKLPSNEYVKKRKLTMVNKAENSLSGMIWTKRLKKWILPNVLPSFQFICQDSQNVTDENRELRNVVNFLKSTNGNQNDGTVLAIDFKDAFRSTSLRWCNLVMKAMNIPEDFILWLWAMYDNLCISVVVNKWLSDKISVKRGFMEGHAPSMGAFVLAMAPLGHVLEEALEGITTPDGTKHTVKAFADDVKLVLKDLNAELRRVYDIISKFEFVSGTEMHRDPLRGKCQALPFGSHRNHDEWPAWITVKNEIKILGVLYSNTDSMEKCNSREILDLVNNQIMGNFSMRGTPLQKASFVNMYIFSKIWYVAQTIKLESDVLKKITQKVLNFIWAGQNERPVRALNFRAKDLGGLGLVCPATKSKALLLKSMGKDFMNYGNQIAEIGKLYGYKSDFKKLLEEGIDRKNVKQIYEFLMTDVCYRNASLIPSREEKRTCGVKWKTAWSNLKLTKSVTAQEKYFQWQVQQDMLPIGNRLHRPGAEKRCLSLLGNNTICICLNDRKHAFLSCLRSPVVERSVMNILSDFLERPVSEEEILHFSFNHRNKKRLKLALWFAVKMLFLIHSRKCLNKMQLLAEIQKEIQWNLKMMRKFGSHSEVIALKESILRNS